VRRLPRRSRPSVSVGRAKAGWLPRATARQATLANKPAPAKQFLSLPFRPGSCAKDEYRVMAAVPPEPRL
jgi:hypothetical protein